MYPILMRRSGVLRGANDYPSHGLAFSIAGRYMSGACLERVDKGQRQSFSEMILYYQEIIPSSAIYLGLY